MNNNEFKNAYIKVSSKSRLDEIEDTTDSVVCTVNDLKEANTRFEKFIVDHEKRNSEAFLAIYRKIKKSSQISKQADKHLCQELYRNEAENKLRFKRIKYMLIASGIANIISLAAHVIFYILNY